MVKTKKEDSDSKNTGKEIKAVWRNFFTLQRRNELKLNKRRTILHQTLYIIIFDFFHADHSILKPGIVTQRNILNLVLVAIQIISKSLVGRGNRGIICKINLNLGSKNCLKRPGMWMLFHILAPTYLIDGCVLLEKNCTRYRLN